MEPRAHHIIVGLFTLIITLAAILFSLWLSKAGGDKNMKNYTVVFTEPVRGLSRGAAVQYNGIRIGEITQLELDPHNIKRVLASISIQDYIPVKQDTRARLTLTSITGSSVIELTGGSKNSPLLSVANPDAPPYIMAEPSPISQLMSGGEDLMNNLSELVLNANNFLSEKNAKSVGKSLDQLEQLLEQLSAGTENLPELIHSLTQTSDEATQVLNGARKLVSQEGNHLFAQAGEVMKNINAMTAELKNVITSNAPSINQGSQGLAQLAPIMQELRQTLNNIKLITQEVQENPKGYLFGADKLQEFQP